MGVVDHRCPMAEKDREDDVGKQRKRQEWIKPAEEGGAKDDDQENAQQSLHRRRRERPENASADQTRDQETDEEV